MFNRVKYTQMISVQKNLVISTLLIEFILASQVFVADAQYDQVHTKSKSGDFQGAVHYPEHQISEFNEPVDDRPKVRVGFRLRVPAFKVNLPPVNLPKITVSAKIQQPNRVRTIRLPEINLDTSSQVSSGSENQQPLYNQQEIDQTVNYAPKHHESSKIPSNGYYSMSPSNQIFSQSTQFFSLNNEADNTYNTKPNQVDYDTINYHNHYPKRQQQYSNNVQNIGYMNRIRDTDLGFDYPIDVYGSNGQPRPIRSANLSYEPNAQTNNQQVTKVNEDQGKRGSGRLRSRIRRLIYG